MKIFILSFSVMSGQWETIGVFKEINKAEEKTKEHFDNLEEEDSEFSSYKLEEVEVDCMEDPDSSQVYFWVSDVSDEEKFILKEDYFSSQVIQTC